MKVVGILSLLAGAALLALYVVGWVMLLNEHGPSEALPIGFTLWPGNALQVTIFVLMVAFLAGGLQLLTTRNDRS
jgi:hypothetical protein